MPIEALPTLCVSRLSMMSPGTMKLP